MELRSHFLGMLGRIEPSQSHVTRAKRAQEAIREKLRHDTEIGKAYIDTYLAGSYARHTAIKDINDVDIICLLDIDIQKTEPLVVLRWLEASLLKYYSTIQVQGRSVGVRTSDGFNLDVVPAVPIDQPGGPLRIPDREAKIWVATHPKGQMTFATSRNDSTDGYYVQVIKIQKHWRDRIPEIAQPKSYIVECLVAESMSTGPPRSHAEAIVRVFEGIKTRHGSVVGTGRVPAIRDPGYAVVVVTRRWTSAEFDAFMANAAKAVALSRDAFEEIDEAKSARLWRQLLGPEFDN